MASKFYLRILEGNFKLEHFKHLNEILQIYLQLLTVEANDFLSMTRTDCGYSLLRSDEGGNYTCMELSTCDPGLYESDILAPATQLFSTHNIPILCISTFTSNFILFDQQYYDDVVSVIEEEEDFEISITQHNDN